MAQGSTAIRRVVHLQFILGVSPFLYCARRHAQRHSYFFQLAGNKDPFMVTVIIKSCGLVAVAFDAALVDRLGRRVMTLIGFGGACFGVTLMAIIGCLDYENPQLGAVLVFAGVSANFFNTIQSSTSYAYLTEMPEERFRARATGWGLAYCNLYVNSRPHVHWRSLTMLQIRRDVQLYSPIDVGCLASQGCFPLCRPWYPVSLVSHIAP